MEFTNKLTFFFAGVIERESPAYNRLIQTKFGLSEMLKWQQYVLCESVVSSPIYRQEGYELITKPPIVHPQSLIPTRKPLAFRHREYTHENLIFECIICKVTRLIKNIKMITNLYVTQSYDNEESVYVLKVEKDGIILDKYFSRVPVLMNVHDISTVEDFPSW